MKAARLSHATARLAVAAAVPVLLAGLASCSSDDGGGDPADGAGSSAPSSADAGTTSAAPSADGPFGPGCGLFPAEGAGSLAGLAASPLATAISTVPDLSSLAQAALGTNLVDVLNSRPEVTVFAPTNAAFDALGPDELPALFSDPPRLTALLTHHVVNGRLTPDQVVGEHTTLYGDSVVVAGPAGAPTFPAEQTATGTAGTVVCGNVPTANATVYVIDQVLTPAG